MLAIGASYTLSSLHAFGFNELEFGIPFEKVFFGGFGFFLWHNIGRKRFNIFIHETLSIFGGADAKLPLLRENVVRFLLGGKALNFPM